MAYTVLVADDEEAILNDILYILKDIPEIKIVGACPNGISALQQINQMQPNIVFLDIMMPGINGIELGKTLSRMKDPPYIIFVTAYSEYAVDAINMGANAYLLKPFTAKDIHQAIEKAVLSFEEAAAGSSKFILKDEDSFFFFDLDEITMAYAENREVFLRVNGEIYKSNLTLKEIRKRLGGGNFFQTHRNYIVNLDKISKIVLWFNNTYLVTLVDRKGSVEVPLSRENVKAFKALYKM